jgi:hypothetical protein
MDDSNTFGEQFTTHRICDMETDSVANPLLVVFAVEFARTALNFACLSIRLPACNNLKTAELNFMLFNTEVFCYNLSIYYNQTTLTNTS